MKPIWNELLAKGELDLILYKFKQYLGSVGKEIQNRQLKNIPYKGDNA